MKLHIVRHDLGVKLYGDRKFFRHLRNECDRLANSDVGDYCEFQTIELSERQNLDPENGVEHLVLSVGDVMNLEQAVVVDEVDFDVNFMVIESKDFDKMKKISS